MPNRKLIELKKIESFKELIYVNKSYAGYIYQDRDGDYLFKPVFFLVSPRIGKGKVLKEIAERLIELNYPKEKKK